MKIYQWNLRAFAVYNIQPRKMELFVSNLKGSAQKGSGKTDIPLETYHLQNSTTCHIIYEF
jgi:hypothetical protein